MKSSSSLRAHHLKKQEVHIRHRFSQDRRCGSHKLWDVVNMAQCSPGDFSQQPSNASLGM